MRKAMAFVAIVLTLAVSTTRTFGQLGQQPVTTRHWVLQTDLGPIGLMTGTFPVADREIRAARLYVFFFGPFGTCSLLDGRFRYEARSETPYIGFAAIALAAG